MKSFFDFWYDYIALVLFYTKEIAEYQSTYETNKAYKNKSSPINSHEMI